MITVIVTVIDDDATPTSWGSVETFKSTYDERPTLVAVEGAPVPAIHPYHVVLEAFGGSEWNHLDAPSMRMVTVFDHANGEVS